MRKFPSVLSAFVLAAGSLGILVTRNIIEVFLCAELISIALFYVFFTSAIPIAFPQRKDPEAIFIGGAGKPPYVSADELLAPRLALLPGDADQNNRSEAKRMKK
jgi:hypothetical protein